MRHAMTVAFAVALWAEATAGFAGDDLIQLAERPIVFQGTAEYATRAAGLKLSAEDAAQAVRNALKPDPGLFAILADPLLIHRHDYVFPVPRLKAGISLRGYYVNGNTGQVRCLRMPEELEAEYGRMFEPERYKFGYITWKMAEKLRHRGED